MEESKYILNIGRIVASISTVSTIHGTHKHYRHLSMNKRQTDTSEFMQLASIKPVMLKKNTIIKT
jgi:hypothetical protein